MSEAERLVRVWRGLRYGRIEHRFAAPRTEEWTGMPAEGGAFGAAPPQVAPSWPGGELGAETSEDCLFLNVWSPVDPDADAPVLLWIFGGGFEGGAASMPVADGAALAARSGCVVVTANYRLGGIGFAYLAHHGGRLAEASNLGLRDVLAALEWTVENIGHFGGDPRRVTLAGQSAGGFLATAAAVAPPSRVAALATFSGGASRLIPESEARGVGDHLLRELGIATTPEKIISIDLAQIIAAQSAVIASDIGERNGRYPRAYGVVADASAPFPVVPVHPMDVIARGGLRDVRLLVASTLDEVAGFRPFTTVPRTVVEVEAEITNAVDDSAARARIISHYANEDPWLMRERFLTDYIYRLPAARTAKAQRAAGGSAWRLEIGGDGGPAPHGVELPTLFARGALDVDGHRDARLFALFAGFVRGDLTSDWSEAVVGDRGFQAGDDELVRLWKGVERP